MNEEKETKKQFSNGESLEGQENHKEKSLQERKDVFENNFEKELIEKKLGEELEKMKVDPEKLKKEIKIEKEQIANIEKGGKLTRLVNIARIKGAPFAVGVAKDMNDPYLLDALHDILVQNGFYKEFLK